MKLILKSKGEKGIFEIQRTKVVFSGEQKLEPNQFGF
jgi:hypothetical protein